jgi:hypothetical protein
MKAGALSKARGWSLNWIVRGHCVGQDQLRPLDFSKLTKTEKRRVAKRSHALSRYLGDYQKGKFAVEDSSTLDPRRDFAGQSLVEDSTTTNCGKPENPPFCSVEDSSHYINTMGVWGAVPSHEPAPFTWVA